jgi:hypothetical protein
VSAALYLPARAGQDEDVTGADLLQEAAAELYSADPDEFVERRKGLVARARAAGETSAAKQIAGLRKPTRSAWVVNQLVRSAPEVPNELASLGDELRDAQGSLDGAAIRELSRRRRQLVEALARQAFTAAGLDSPPAALRDEVTATLGAALADPQVAEQMAAGAMARVAHRDGLGPPDAPDLTLATPPSGGRTKAAASKAQGPRPAKLTAEERAQARAEAKARAAEEAAAARERRRQEAMAGAEQAVAEADRAAEAAGAAEQELEDSVQQLEEGLADARRRLTEARLSARRARNAQRSARRELDRLRK